MRRPPTRCWRLKTRSDNDSHKLLQIGSIGGLRARQRRVLPLEMKKHFRFCAIAGNLKVLRPRCPLLRRISKVLEMSETMPIAGRPNLILLLGCGALLAANDWAADLHNQPVPGPVPFVIEATENVSQRFPGAPQLQSFAWAQWDGKWIFIAGRTSGYHGVGGKEADFPRASANTRIWVVDPSGPGPARTFSFPVTDLPPSLGVVKDQWMSSNVLFFQDRTRSIWRAAMGRTRRVTGSPIRFFPRLTCLL